jgi:hypothetical protein
MGRAAVGSGHARIGFLSAASKDARERPDVLEFFNRPEEFERPGC